MLEDLVNHLTPIVNNECPTFHRDIGNRPGSLHHEKLVITVLCKFVSPLLKNYSKSINGEITRLAAEQRKEKRAAAFIAAAVTKQLATTAEAATNQSFNAKTKVEMRKLRTYHP